MDGNGPRTGKIRTRKSSNAPNSLTGPFLNSSSSKGSSLTSLGTSVEYTTGMPDDTPRRRRRRRTERARGSYIVYEMSLI